MPKGPVDLSAGLQPKQAPIDLSAGLGSTPPTPPEPPSMLDRLTTSQPDEGFWTTAGKRLLNDVLPLQGIKNAETDPVGTAGSALTGMLNIFNPASGTQATDEAQSLIASPHPVATGLGDIGALGLGAAGAKLGSEIPTRASAGALLDEVSNAAKNQPVNLTKAAQPLQRITELGVRGGTLPKAANDLLTRSQAIEPMSFPEARDYYSNLSDLSRNEAGGLNRKMLAATGRLRQGFHQDLTDAANEVGRGEDYIKGMRDYARGSQLQNLLTTGAKYAIPAIGGGAAAEYVLRKLLPGGGQ